MVESILTQAMSTVGVSLASSTRDHYILLAYIINGFGNNVLTNQGSEILPQMQNSLKEHLKLPLHSVAH